MRIKFFVIGAMFFSGVVFAEIKKGHEEGNGGDGYALAFVKEARALLLDLKKLPQEKIPFSLNDLEVAISKTQVTSTEQQLFLSGIEKDAINYPSKMTIVVNRDRWDSLAAESLRRALVLHEYLGILQVADATYNISSQLVLETRAPAKPVGEFALLGAAGNVASFAVDPQGQRLAMASQDGRILVWNIESRSIESMVISGVKNVEALQFVDSRAYQSLLAVAGRGRVELWKLGMVDGVPNSERVAQAALPVHEIAHFSAIENKGISVLVGGHLASQLYLVKLGPMTQITHLTGDLLADDFNYLYKSQLNQKHSLAAASNSQKTLRIWDVNQPSLLREIKFEQTTQGLALSKIPGLLMTSDYDAKASVYSLNSENSNKVIEYTLSQPQKYTASSVYWGANERSVIVVGNVKAGAGTIVEIFDAHNAQRIGVLELAEWSPVVVDPKGRFLFTLQNNKVVAWAMPKVSKGSLEYLNCKRSSGDIPYQSLRIGFETKNGFLSSYKVKSFDAKTDEGYGDSGIPTSDRAGSSSRLTEDLELGEINVDSVEFDRSFGLSFGMDFGCGATYFELNKRANGKVVLDLETNTDGPSYNGRFHCELPKFKPLGA